MSLTTLSQLIFASPYRALLYLVSLRSQLIFSLRYFVYIYIIKLSYYRVRFCFNIEPPIHSFICFNVFQHRFLSAFTFPPFSSSLSLSAPHASSSSRTLSLSPVSFFFLFYFIQTRVSLSSTALCGVSQGYKGPYTRLRDSASHRIATHAKLFRSRRTA